MSDKINIRPLGDRMLVKPIEKEKQERGGLIIPETAKEKPQEGTVLSVGKGKVTNGILVPLDVKVGDIVMYSKYSGTEIKLNDEVHLIMHQDDIIGILESN